LDVDIVHPIGTDTATLSALIDTGADISIIPRRLQVLWKLFQFSSMTSVDFRGAEKDEDTYLVRVKIADLYSGLIEVILSDEDEVIIGRDILNKLILNADGINQVFALNEGIVQRPSE
jgi:predicted aspartyl protease